MAKIEKDNQVFTVMVDIDVESEFSEQFTEISLQWANFFKSQPGFVSQTIHKSHDGTRFVVYLQWKSEQDHLNCKNAGKIEPESDFAKLIQSGKIKMIDRTFDVIYSS